MRTTAYLLAVFILASLPLPISVQAQKQLAQATRIMSAKSVYLDDRTGVDDVAKRELNEIKKWGRFRIVQDRKMADLILLLSANPYKGGYIIMSGGQTGTIDVHGKINVDPIPNYNKQAPVRYAYLKLIDPKTGANLATTSHRCAARPPGINRV